MLTITLTGMERMDQVIWNLLWLLIWNLFLASLYDFCSGIRNQHFFVTNAQSLSIISTHWLRILAWDGKEEPRLLSSEKSDASTKEKACKEFASYAWADEKKSVKIYVDYEGADQVDDNDISLENTKTSIDFTVSLPGNPFLDQNTFLLPFDIHICLLSLNFFSIFSRC